MPDNGEQLVRSRHDTVTRVLGLAAIAGATAFVIWQLRPDLIFSSSMDVGGDNAGHVAAPYFLIHDLLPQGRITGWDPQWFEGFPLYVFYFPLPALMVAAFSLVFQYAVAFKVVTILGSVALPVAAWAFGALAGFRRPVPVLMGLAMLPFLFNTAYTIEGGNLTSTLAGEFSFSLAITFGLLFLGVFSYALRTGRLRWLAAALYAATLLCHVVPALAFAAVAVALSVSRWDRKAWRVLVPVGAVGGLLGAFWLVPFAADLPYSTSMGYTRVEGFFSNVLPSGFIWMLVPALIGVVAAAIRRQRTALVLSLCALGSVAGFQWLPAGLVYNGRWIPFWFLFVSLLAAYGIGEVFRGLGSWLSLPSLDGPVVTVLGSLGALVGAVIAGGIIGVLPGYQPAGAQVQVPGWTSWNYTGFQGKTGWPVFQGIIRMLDKAGSTYGCGRLQYEYITETQDPFGSTEATMSIPYWTGGCMDTIDGIYFESSTTTLFHFLDQAQYSLPGETSNPVSYLTYPTFDLAAGIRHLRFAGVRYFMAVSPQVEKAAVGVPGLVKIASTPGFPGSIDSAPNPHPVWDLYLIEGSSLVTPLAHLPVVEANTSTTTWQATNLTWWESESYWPVELVRSGPAYWPHARPGTLVPPDRAVAVAPTSVADVHTTNSTISFDVGRLDVPVLVKVPYFPNWQASGALGPFEGSPNLMVVVPTSHHVVLTYGTTGADYLGKAASLAGVLGLGTLLTLRPPTMRVLPVRPTRSRVPEEPEVAPEPEDDPDPDDQDLGGQDLGSSKVEGDGAAHFDEAQVDGAAGDAQSAAGEEPG